MFKKTLFVLAIVSSVTLTVGGQDARSVVAAASKAMGADQLKTIQYSGPGTEYSFGQAYNPGSPWPAWKNKSYTRTIDFDARAMRIERVADAPEPGRKGGGLQPGAMQQLIVNANTPWAAQLPIWITPYRVPHAGGSQHGDDDVADRRREEIHRRDLHRSEQGEGERLYRRRQHDRQGRDVDGHARAGRYAV